MNQHECASNSFNLTNILLFISQKGSIDELNRLNDRTRNEVEVKMAPKAEACICNKMIKKMLKQILCKIWIRKTLFGLKVEKKSWIKKLLLTIG